MKIDLSELDAFIKTLDVSVADIPQDIIRQCLEEISKEVGKDVQSNARKSNMLRGKYNYNEVANSINFKKSVDSKGNYYIEINFKGNAPRVKKQGGVERNAAIAFLNEYGVPTHAKQPSRPFLRAASVTGLHRAMPKVEKILGDWFEKAFMDSIF